MVQKESLIATEVYRYQSKGFGAAFALLQIALVAYFYKPVAQWGWTEILRIQAQNNWTIAQLHFVVATTNNTLVSVAIQGSFALTYWLGWEVFERYKVLEEPWPWESDPKGWPTFKRRSIFLYCFNHFGLSTVFSAMFHVLGTEPSYSWAPEVPPTATFFGHLMFCMMSEDLFFHLSHRLLHHRYVYPYIHKIHHEHRVTIACAVAYAHPLEYLFGNLGTTVIGVLLLGKKMHAVTLFAWFAVRVLESSEGHSGYEFSWSPFRMLPFASDYGYHVYHHSHNMGNYSSFFTTWDTILGSNKDYWAYVEEKEQAQALKKKTL